MLIFLLPSNIILATPSDSLILEASKLELHKHKTWKQLLHYKSSFLGFKQKSEIISQSFFIAENGRFNSESELNLTIENYFKPITNDDDHPQCKYPARYHWLKQQLTWPENAPKANCNAFKQWSNINKLDDIELVFVSGYFGNPASFFGHLIIKLHAPELTKNNALLDQTIDFGAIVPDNENSIRYIWKGLTGGYKSTFSDQHFFAINHMYSEKDLRDQWSYKLNLTDDQKTLFIAHLWEVMGFEFNYFFFDKNCGYYIADTLQLIIDEPLLNYRLPWSFPSSVFDYLTRNQEKLVKNITYIPSRQSKFYTSYQSLNTSLKNISTLLINNNYNFKLTDYLKLEKNEKQKIVDVLLDYNLYLHYKAKASSQTIKEQKTNIILERLKLNIKSPKRHIIAPSAPHLGQRPTKISFSLNAKANNTLSHSLNLRCAYYDHLAISPGRPPHSALEFIDISLTNYEKQLSISHLTFINIEKLGISQTGLDQDKTRTWNGSFGIYKKDQRQNIANRWLLQGGFGHTKQFTKSVIGFAMIDARTVLNHLDESHLSLRTSILFEPLKWLSSQYTLATRPLYLYHEAELRLGFSRMTDIRIKIIKDAVETYTISTALYF